MAITNLQQARQMYALGQRVRFQGGGRDASQDDFSSPSADGPGNNKGGGTNAVDTGDLGTEKANVEANRDANMSSRERAIMNQYRNVPTPTITLGVDKFDKPITIPTTYQAKRQRQLALDALNKKGISAFDPRVTKNLNLLDMSFAPQQKKFGLFDLALLAAGPFGLFGSKAASVAKGINAAKFALEKSKQIGGLLETIGLTDKNVVDSFIGSLSSKTPTFSFDKTKTKTTKNEDDNKDRGGDGLGSLENMDALNEEYLLLLNKFNTGVFNDADQVRFTFLQKILGK
jgi:hypothetical protein|tara:strand:+ start:721 stop:1581 length:861 start_codon:yes stop_codon:yes gene_type:complete